MAQSKLVVSVAGALLVIAAVVFFLLKEDGDSGASGGGENTPDVLTADSETDGEADGEAGDPATDADPEAATGDEVAQEETPEEVEDRGPVSIRGFVRDGDSKPVEGARVALLHIKGWRANLDDVEQRFRNPMTALRILKNEFREIAAKAPATRSREDGSFTFHEVPTGAMTVMVYHPSFLPNTQSSVIVETATPPEDEIPQLEIVLDRALSIRGKVLGTDDQPMAGALVSAAPIETSRMRGMGKMMQIITGLFEGRMLLDSEAVATGEDGSFEIGGLEPLIYDVSVVKEGFASTTLRNVKSDGPEVILVVDAGFSVGGKVFDPSGNVVAGAKVTIREPQKDLSRMNPILMANAEIDFLGEKTRLGETDEGGEFSVGGLRTGFYELLVETEDYPRYRKVINVRDSMSVDRVDLEKPLSIRGVVRKANGTSVDVARVWLTKRMDLSRHWEARQLPPLGEAEVDDRGRFEISGLGQAKFTIHAHSDEFGHVMAQAESGDSSVNLTFPESVRVRGRLLDKEDREPIAGAKVRVNGGMSMTVRSDDEGRFELAGVTTESLDRSNQNVHVSIQHPQYPRTYQSIQVKEGQEAEVLVSRGGGLEGTVVDANGDPVFGAKVAFEVPGIPTIFMTIDRGVSDSTFTAKDGSFVMTVPQQAQRMGVDIVATHPKHGRARIGLEKPQGDESKLPDTLDIVLTPPVVLNGKITDLSGQPVDRAQIRISRVSNSKDPELAMISQLMPPSAGLVAYSAEDGAYRAARLEAATYRVEVRALGYAKKVLDDIEIPEDGKALDIALDPGATIRGRVVDTNRDPVAGAEVVAFLEYESQTGDQSDYMVEYNRQLRAAAGRGVSTTKSRDDGSFELIQLPEGKFQLVVRAEGYAIETAPGIGADQDAGEIALKANASLVGTVRDENGVAVTSFSFRIQPVREDGRQIYIDDRHRRQQNVQDSEGQFAMDRLGAGKYTVRVEAEGFAPGFQKVELRPGEESRVDIVMAEGAPFACVVTDANTGDPISNLRVYVNSAGNTSSDQNGRTDAAGRFATEGLGEGKYMLNFQHRYYYDPKGSQEFEIVGRDGLELSFQLQLGGVAKGRVKGFAQPGDSRSGAMIVFEPFEPATANEDGTIVGPKTHSTWVNPNEGRYRANGLAPGKYRVRWRPYSPGEQFAQEGGEEIGEVEIVAGETSDVDFTAP
ncbi:MAG: carboxypeptidase-like regulatory domain-containing protein [Planctomycetota bacterium]